MEIINWLFKMVIEVSSDKNLLQLPELTVIDLASIYNTAHAIARLAA